MLPSQLLRYMAFVTLITHGYTKEINAQGFLDSLVEKHRNTVKKELEELSYAPEEEARVLSSFANLKGDSLNPQVGPILIGKFTKKSLESMVKVVKEKHPQLDAYDLVPEDYVLRDRYVLLTPFSGFHNDELL